MSSPGRQSRSPQGWGTQLLTAILGTPRENPNFGKDQESANMEKGGRQVDVESPFKKAGFRSVFGDPSDVKNVEYRIGNKMLEKEYGLRGGLVEKQAQMARDNFLLENAENIKNSVRQNIANKYGITEESHPELYKQYQSQILPGIVQNQFAEQQALASKSANEAGLASDLSQQTRPTRLQTGLTEANTGLLGARTGESQAAAGLRRQPVINSNLDMMARLAPQRTGIEMQRESLLPLGHDRLLTLGNSPSITQFPSQEQTQMATLLGQPAPRISSQPFGTQDGITLSDGTFIPKAGGKVTSPFENVINATTPLPQGGSRAMPNNFIRPTSPFESRQAEPSAINLQTQPQSSSLLSPTLSVPTINSYDIMKERARAAMPKNLTPEEQEILRKKQLERMIGAGFGMPGVR